VVSVALSAFPYIGGKTRLADWVDLYRVSADHARLERSLREIDGYAIVSYTEIPSGLYDDFNVVEQTVTHSAAGNGKTADERLLMNFDPDEFPQFSSGQQATLRFDDRSLQPESDRSGREQ